MQVLERFNSLHKEMKLSKNGPGISTSDFKSICDCLECLGLIRIKPNKKAANLSIIQLTVPEDEAVIAFVGDVPILQKILDLPK
jgi:hypothetical protein